eukprot:gene9656-10676_t
MERKQETPRNNYPSKPKGRKQTDEAHKPPSSEKGKATSNAKGGRGSFDRVPRGQGGRGGGQQKAADNGERQTNASSRSRTNIVPSTSDVSLVSADVERFCRSISKVIKGDKRQLHELIMNQKQLWIASFDCAASKTTVSHYHYDLLSVYRQLIDNSVLGVIQSYLESGNRHGEWPNLVLQVIEKLKRESSLKKITEKDTLLATLDRVESTLSTALTSLTCSREERLKIKKDIEETITSYIKLIGDHSVGRETEEGKPSADIPSWSQTPTVKWLLDAEWLHFQKPKDRYDSIEDYCSTMRGVWTALSFYWGAAALSPRCYNRPNREGNGNANFDSCCLNPILHPADGLQGCTSKVRTERGEKRVCGGNAIWRCYRRGHDAICSQCLQKQRVEILGHPKERFSSTDIYDGTISQVTTKNDSTVLHLSSVQSRKPADNVNWFTTYRLQPTSLAAIIPLPARGVSLQERFPIYWAEIVAKEDDTKSECARRSRGELSVRLLNQSDSSTLSDQFDSNSNLFKKDCMLAIIDCRVFVPEVISVLSTLSSDAMEKSLRYLQFTNLILGSQHMEELVELDCTTDNWNRDLFVGLICRSIDQSDIKSIQRLSLADKQTLLRRIIALPQVMEMDRTQGMAFCGAIRNTVHCTQGPPGTGKSYTGVCVVQALQLVRELLKANGESVGPIVVLSYKNHALDEFLLDVQNAFSQRKGRLPPGKMIRLGKPENETLLNYKERSSPLEIEAKKALEKLLREMKEYANISRDCSWFVPGDVSDKDVERLICCIFFCLKHENECRYDKLSPQEALQLLQMFPKYIDEEALRVFKNNSADYLLPTDKYCMPSSDPVKLLKLWLQGEALTPRCLKQVKDDNRMEFRRCKNPAKDHSPYCSDHACKTNDCVGSKLDGGKLYCGLHQCDMTTCLQPRVEGIDWCAEHACPFCSEARPVCEGYHTCIDHRCDVEGCIKPCLFPLTVCLDHKCRSCDDKILIVDNKDGNQPIDTASGYCEKHLAAKESSEDSTNLMCQPCDAEVVFCSGRTSKNKACKTKRPSKDQDKLWYCKDHSSQMPASKAKKVAPKKIDLIAERRDQEVKKCVFDQCKVQISSTLRTDRWMCFVHQQIELKGKEIDEEAIDSDRTVSSKSASLTTNNDGSKAAPTIGKANIPTMQYASPAHDHSSLDLTKDKQTSASVEDYEIITDDIPVQHLQDRNGAIDQDELSLGEEMLLEDDEQVSHNHPQEWNVSSGAEFEEEDLENDNDKERQELYRSDDESEEEDEFELSALIREKNERIRLLNSNDFQQKVVACRRWTWEMTAADRRQAAQELLLFVGGVLNYLLSASSAVVDEHRKARANANAVTLRSADVIGATVVGMTKRLPAIRAAGPFAILVEEACEVMEATLISALAIESLNKVELIGDHRQLPASISQNWYHFEITVPQLKKSLFERLVEVNRSSGQSNANALCSILDVQRRMRPYLADLTRGHYKDLTQIIDHRITKERLIGDCAYSKNNDMHGSRLFKQVMEVRSSWADRGIQMPCLTQNLFFWDILNNSQSKPKAGLSACNETEAKAVARMVKFMKLCGIPDKSITVLTPYKGQKRLIIEKLREMGCINRGQNSSQQTELIVSTVDRYQGDENDVVILSLVRTRPGNAFVSFRNRFIVATSRARIGFYIVGTSQAVVPTGDSNTRSSLTHWQILLHQLREKDPPQIGSTLQLCCPQHPQSTLGINSVHSDAWPCIDQWAGLCSVCCTFTLPCSHPCNLRCHSFDPLAHTKKCNQLLPSTCPRHREKTVPCHELTDKWKCELVEEYFFPNCKHPVGLPCFEYDKIQSQRKPWPQCDHPVVNYIHPACGHIFENMTCAKRSLYEANPPVCFQKVPIRYPCEHTVRIACHLSRQPLSPCEAPVTINRPRCGHQLSQRCHEGEKLIEQYHRHVCPSQIHPVEEDPSLKKVVLYEDRQYAPAENVLLPDFATLPNCQVPVIVKLSSCSHSMQMMCCDAYDVINSKRELKCVEKFKLCCPLCGSNIVMKCHEAQSLNKLSELINYNTAFTNESFRREEDLNDMKIKLLPYTALLMGAKCKGKIQLKRRCNDHHIEKFSCMEVIQHILGQKLLPKCRTIIEQIRSCGHKIKRPCHENGKPIAAQCTEIVDEIIRFRECNHQKILRTCIELQNFLALPHQRCEDVVTEQLYRCGHDVPIQCYQKKVCSQPRTPTDRNKRLCDTNGQVYSNQIYCEPCLEAPHCEEKVDFIMSCGHLRKAVKCDEAFGWTIGLDGREPPCKEKVPMKSPLCHHMLTINCCNVEELCEWQPWEDISEKPLTTITIGQVEEQLLFYPFEDFQRPTIPASILNLLPPCEQLTTVCFNSCGHTGKVKCHKAFSEPQTIECQEIVQVKCPDCGNVHDWPCRRQEKFICTSSVPRKCSVCKINVAKAPCNELVVVCGEIVKDTLACGHIVEWQCKADGSEDPRRFHDNENGYNKRCAQCAINRWTTMIGNEKIDEHHLRGIMLNKCKMHENELRQKGYVEKSNVSVTLADMSPHHTAQDIIIQNIIHHLEIVQTEPCSKDNVIPWPKSAADPENYELVYLPMCDDNSQVEDVLKPSVTSYGNGISVQRFAVDDAMGRLFTAKKKIKLCLAMVFTAHKLDKVNPFLIVDPKRQQQDISKVSIAAETKELYRSKGYDCVVVRENDKLTGEMIIWKSDCVIPLNVIELELENECSICLIRQPCDNTCGAICDQGHFICWEKDDDCFGNYLENAKKLDNEAKSVSEDGRLLCPECHIPYNIMRIARIAPEYIAEGLMDLQASAKVNKEVKEVVRQQQEEFKAELERIKAMNEEDAQVYFLYKEVADNILNLRCPNPRCNIAFDDFVGCFALTCVHCNCHICAWCFKWGTYDMHAHVVHCNVGNGDVWGDKVLWKRACNQRRIQALKDLMKDKPPSIKRKLLDKLRRDLQDLEINMNAFN